MNWWCSAGQGPWTWTWIPYPGVWLFIAVVGAVYVWGIRRGPAGPGDGRRRHLLLFLGGLALLWIILDWPIGTLGSSYLASVHMLQYQVITLFVSSLMLAGMPEDRFRRLVERLRLYGVVAWFSRPFVAGFTFNLILVGTHAPVTVDLLRTSQAGSFALDMLWIFSGIVLWLPIINPLPELRRRSPAVKLIYLFLAGGAFAMIPGGFITFASTPLYQIYETAPRVAGITAIDDQQFAGFVMKVGNLPVVWIAMYITFMRWARDDQRTSRSHIVADPSRPAEPADAPGAEDAGPGLEDARPVRAEPAARSVDLTEPEPEPTPLVVAAIEPPADGDRIKEPVATVGSPGLHR